MPNPKPKSPKKTSVKKSIPHVDYTRRLEQHQANEKDNSFSGNEFYRLFGYQQKLRKGGTRKKNKRKRKTYKRKCK